MLSKSDDFDMSDSSSPAVSATKPKYEQHLTAFVDFLGFSESTFDEPDKTEALLEMLSGSQVCNQKLVDRI